MKTLAFLFVLTVSAFWSCNQCSDIDCDPAAMTVAKFRFVNGSGTDLMFGPSKVYDESDVKFFHVKGNDTFNIAHQVIVWNPSDTVFSVNLPADAARVFIELSPADTDTLDIKYKTYESKCCGTIHEFTKFRFNEKFDILPDYEPRNLTKW